MKTIYYTYPNNVNNKNAGIEIRSKNEMSDDELNLVRQANLDIIDEIEAWTALGTNTQISYSSHGLFRYFGKFPSTIGAHLIMTYTKEFQQVMDPMGGSGTTALECLLANRNCRSYDINPFSVLLEKVKTTHIEESKLKTILEKINQEYKPLSIDEYDWVPVGLKDVDHWFLPKTQDSIRGIIKIINEINEDNIKNFFLICLASSIRTVSRATSQQGRLFLDVTTAQEDCLQTFNKKAKKAIESIAELPTPKVKLDIEIHNSNDTFNIDTLNDLIIVHPPYFNSYKYSSVNSLELAWMKIDHASVRKNEVKEFFKVGKPENVTRYVNDMNSSLNKIVETLNVDGVLALMIGDTIIKGNYIPATKQLIDVFLKNNGKIKIEKIVLRVPKYTEASWTASQRRKTNNVGITLNDFIIICRRVK